MSPRKWQSIDGPPPQRLCDRTRRHHAVPRNIGLFELDASQLLHGRCGVRGMELASRARDVDQRAASYYVLYRLAQLGYAASATAAGHAELMACTPDGGRVALLRVRSSGPNGRFDLTEADRRPSGRNVSYVFVDFASGAADPEVFILRPALVLAMLAIDADWPRDARAFRDMEAYRDGWHLLGLGQSSVARSAGESSPSWSP